MFDNIGKKLQKTAKVFLALVLILSIITGLLCIILPFLLEVEEQFGFISFIGIGVIAFGPISTWAVAALIYGFGKLIIDVEALRSKTPANETNEQHIFATAKAIKYTDQGVEPKYEGNGYRCPVCKMSMDSMLPCEKCGYIPPKSN